MSRNRSIVVFILLVLILLVASVLFGVLTYGLGTDRSPDSAPGQGSAGKMQLAALSVAEGSEQSSKLPPATPFVILRRGFYQKVGI